MTREFLIYDENEVGHTLKMDDTQLYAYIDDKQRNIAPKDYLFLSALADHVNEVVSREELIAQVEGISFAQKACYQLHSNCYWERVSLIWHAA